jgi:hypothetical protein
MVLAVLGAALGLLLLDGPGAEPTSTVPHLLPPPASSTGVANEGGPRAGATGWPVHAARVREALTVLHAWDARRSAAYATGSGSRLRDLYVAGSPAAAADVGLLERYRARGLRVVGLRTQVLALGIVHQEPGRWTLRVTDRVHAGTVVGAGRRHELPRDAASSRRLTLVRGSDDHWRVAQAADLVRPVRPGRPAVAR